MRTESNPGQSNQRPGISVALIVILLVCGGFYKTASAHATSDKPSAEQPRTKSPAPKSAAGDLDLLSEYAEDIYYLARMNAWHRIDKKTRKFKIETNESVFKDANNKNVSDLGRVLAELEQSIGAKDKFRTMNDANKIFLMSASLSEPYLSIIPRNVLLLGYCGRRLEALAEAANAAKAAETVAKMHLIWQNLIIQMVERGAAREVKRFADILKQLDLAKTPDEYRRLGRLVQDEVEFIEKIFLK